MLDTWEPRGYIPSGVPTLGSMKKYVKIRTSIWLSESKQIFFLPMKKNFKFLLINVIIFYTD